MKIDLHTILLLLAGLLIVVSLVQPLATRLRVSSSVLLAMVGVAIGVASTFLLRTAGGDQFDGFASVIVNLPIHSEAFLYIFLPMLLFQTALEIDMQRIVEDAAPILTLAVVAVVVATAVIGLALAPIAGVPMVACLMLGSIVATTDPVAVIGIFRDVGAPSRLSRLVEGESLLNDAAAITLFVLLLELLVGGHQIHVGEAALSFIRNFLGGILTGYIGGRLIVAALSWLQDMRLAQVTMTLALPYLVFIVGERGLGVSGVVAVVTSGLVMSAVGQPRFAPDDWRFLKEVWEQLAFWASSLIFILASLLVPQMLHNVGWNDLLLLGVLVVAALAARALVLFGMLPLLSALKLSQRVDNKFKTVIVWGGLRGAVTLALALAVTENPQIAPGLKRFIAVLATGFVLFTLLVNGTTLRLLIRLLGLDRLSPLDQALRDQVLTLSRGRVADTLKTIGVRYEIAEDLVADVTKTYRMTPEGTVAAAVEGSTPLVDDNQKMLLGLMALANHERDLVRYQFAERTISGVIVEQMLAGVGRLVDRTRAGGRAEYLRASQRMVEFSRRFRIAHFLHRRFRIDWPLVDSLADRFELLLVNSIVLTELAPYVDEKLEPLVGNSIAAMIHEILRQRQDMTGGALEALRQQYPGYANLLERRFLNRVVLRREDLEYRTLFEEGVVGPELYGSLRRDLITAREKIEVRPVLDLGLETRDLVAKVPMFSAFNAGQLDVVSRLLRPRFALPDEHLIHDGDRADAMYFVSSGNIEVMRAAGEPKHLGRGDFFGEMALVSGKRREGDVFARSYCQLLVLKDDDFQRLCKGSPEIRAQIYQASDQRFDENRRARAAATD